MLSTVPLSSLGARYTPPPGLLAQQCLHSHHHQDCYTPGRTQPEIYSRPVATSTLALAIPQMGDMVLENFPASRFTLGDEPSGQQTQWSDNLGSVPKDCYYCRNNGGTITGRCSNDSPDWGSGKDYMGNDCSQCGGTGVCPHCGGDGILGN